MRKIECSNCGMMAPVARGSYQFKESGLSSVVLQGIEIIQCEHCDNEDPIIPNVNDLIRLLAVRVILKPEKLAGEEIRFLRKTLRMTGEEFSRLLDVDKTMLSKWENDADPIGAQSDRLVRTMALIMGDRLREKLDELVVSFLTARKTKRTKRTKKKVRPLALEVDMQKTPLLQPV
jgi:DNA-binding transcriptional regulator YiaG